MSVLQSFQYLCLYCFKLSSLVLLLLYHPFFFLEVWLPHLLPLFLFLQFYYFKFMLCILHWPINQISLFFIFYMLNLFKLQLLFPQLLTFVFNFNCFFKFKPQHFFLLLLLRYNVLILLNSHKLLLRLKFFLFLRPFPYFLFMLKFLFDNLFSLFPCFLYFFQSFILFHLKHFYSIVKFGNISFHFLSVLPHLAQSNCVF